MKERDLSWDRRHVDGLQDLVAGSDGEKVFQVRRKRLDTLRLRRNITLQHALNVRTHLDLVAMTLSYNGSGRDSIKKLATVEIHIHQHADLVVSHVKFRGVHPGTVSTMQAAVDFHKNRSPFTVHHLGVNGTTFKAEGLQNLFRIVENFLAVLVQNDLQFLAKPEKGGTVVWSLVVFLHGSCFDDSITNDGVDDVLGTSQVLLKKNAGFAVVTVAGSAMGLVF